jgi:hypothetical protein
MDIRVEYIGLSEIAEWPRNPKDHDLPAIRKSFDRFGFIKPILVDEGTEQLVAGHGRLNSLQGMLKDGKAPPKGIKVTDAGWLVPVLRGVEFKDPAEAEAFLLADNRLSEVGGWNKDLLDEMLAEMAGNEDLLEGTGFNLGDIPDIDNLGDIPGVGSGESGKILSCPKCGFEWEKK